MIEFKIISCPDKSQQATYQHMGRELTFGKLEGDMIVDDPGFGPAQLRIRLESANSATIENLNPEVEVRLNGKPVYDATPIKAKDNITVARTTINFVQIDLGPIPSPEPYTNPILKERVSSHNSKEQAIFEALQFLEKSMSSGPSPGSPPLPPGAGTSPKPPLPGGVKPPPLPKKS